MCAGSPPRLSPGSRVTEEAGAEAGPPGALTAAFTGSSGYPSSQLIAQGMPLRSQETTVSLLFICNCF